MTIYIYISYNSGHYIFIGGYMSDLELVCNGLSSVFNSLMLTGTVLIIAVFFGSIKKGIIKNFILLFVVYSFLVAIIFIVSGSETSFQKAEKVCMQIEEKWVSAKGLFYFQ